MKRVVLDASVVLKWYLPDEGDADPALALLDRFGAFKLVLVAPTLLEYEVLNALTVAQRRGRLPEEAVVSAFEGFCGLGIPIVAPSVYSHRVIQFSRTFGVSAYDGCYLSLAEAERIPFVTADERLLRRLGGKLKWVHPIGLF